MTKRDANRRSGDRAETFGAVLMQLFCAVAPAPRPEDFGIWDTVATLLRREGRMLHAEDSFLVQFKSRTEKKVAFCGDRFHALRKQELPFFIAHVDLTAAEVRLHNVSVAMSHPNFDDLNGLVLYLNPRQQRRDNGVLHTWLGEPALKWTSAQLADVEFERKAYVVMKRWLELDRINRRSRRIGIQVGVQWKTNEIPAPSGTTFLWDPNRAKEALGDIVPAIQMIASLATTDASLADSALHLRLWMRERGADPDPSGILSLMAVQCKGQKRLTDALEKHQDAGFAAHFIEVENTPSNLEFWVQSNNRKGLGGATKHSGTVEKIRSLGFELELDPRAERVVRIGLGSEWLKSHNCEIVGMVDDVILLRGIGPGAASMPAGGP